MAFNLVIPVAHRKRRVPYCACPPLDARSRANYTLPEFPNEEENAARLVSSARDCKITRMKLMARRCELSGKGVQSGNNVSHANNRTRRRFLPNLCNVTLLSETLGEQVSLRVSAHALRSVEHRGGLDAFLAKARDSELSSKALSLKRRLAKAKALSATPA